MNKQDIEFKDRDIGLAQSHFSDQAALEQYETHGPPIPHDYFDNWLMTMKDYSGPDPPRFEGDLPPENPSSKAKMLLSTFVHGEYRQNVPHFEFPNLPYIGSFHHDFDEPNSLNLGKMHKAQMAGSGAIKARLVHKSSDQQTNEILDPQSTIQYNTRIAAEHLYRSRDFFNESKIQTKIAPGAAHRCLINSGNVSVELPLNTSDECQARQNRVTSMNSSLFNHRNQIIDIKKEKVADISNVVKNITTRRSLVSDEIANDRTYLDSKETKVLMGAISAAIDHNLSIFNHKKGSSKEMNQKEKLRAMARIYNEIENIEFMGRNGKSMENDTTNRQYRELTNDTNVTNDTIATRKMRKSITVGVLQSLTKMARDGSPNIRNTIIRLGRHKIFSRENIMRSLGITERDINELITLTDTDGKKGKSKSMSANLTKALVNKQIDPILVKNMIRFGISKQIERPGLHPHGRLYVHPENLSVDGIKSNELAAHTKNNLRGVEGGMRDVESIYENTGQDSQEYKKSTPCSFSMRKTGTLPIIE